MIICMMIGSMIFVLFVFFLFSSDEEAYTALKESLSMLQNEKVEKTKDEMILFAQRIKEEGSADSRKVRGQAKMMKRKLKQQTKLLSTYQAGKLGSLDIVPLAGYGVIRIMKWDKGTKFIETLILKCSHYRSKHDASRHANYLLAGLFGYSLLGLALGFVLLGLGLAMAMGMRSIVLFIVCFVGMALIGYLPYDETNRIISDRSEQIERQFPRAMSKMTLLVTAGLEVSHAWKLTCSAEEGTLYEEMRRVLKGLDNNEPPSMVYQEFMDHCNNKFVTKFASTILNNRTKGNAEIALRFRELNSECWSERKHGARRMAEVVQSKLFIPTILMFVGILILVVVPVLSGFNMF